VFPNRPIFFEHRFTVLSRLTAPFRRKSMTLRQPLVEHARVLTLNIGHQFIGTTQESLQQP
jgi:hypothetical protein